MRISKIFLVLVINFISVKPNNNNNYLENYKQGEYSNNNIIILSISYEWFNDIKKVLKIQIKTINKIIYNIKFHAFLKTEDKLNEYMLDCHKELEDLIGCFSCNDFLFDNHKKYYFYYNKQKSGTNLTFNGKEIFEDIKRISLIFNPEIPRNQILYKDYRKFKAKIANNKLSGGYLYIIRKSKKILKKPENGFNKYIEQNNFIPRGGLGIYRPQWTLSAYKEAIRRGYKMVDADLLFTRDKIPVIAHDIELNKVSNGKGSLINKTIHELEKLDFGIKFDKRYAKEKILKLDDLLTLCKENDIILDLDLGHLDYPEFFRNMRNYLKILVKHVEKYDMFNSIVFNDKRQFILDIMTSIRKDISFSINGMNEKKSIEKIKDKYINYIHF